MVSHLVGQVPDHDGVERRERDRALDRVLELAHVAGPRKVIAGRVGAMPKACGPRRGALFAEEVLREEGRGSPPRARSGGRSTWMTLMRKNRSSRKVRFHLVSDRGSSPSGCAHRTAWRRRGTNRALFCSTRRSFGPERKLADLVEEDGAAVRGAKSLAGAASVNAPFT